MGRVIALERLVRHAAGSLRVRVVQAMRNIARAQNVREGRVACAGDCVLDGGCMRTQDGYYVFCMT